MTSSAWDPTQYERFKRERDQPFFDLLAGIAPRRGRRVIDLGCGTGALTAQLHEALQAASTLGVDQSDTMLARSLDHETDSLQFQQAAIEDTFEGDARYDLVFSNAALQWLDDHPALWGQVAGLLAPGGELAIQIPANHDHISHVAARQIATEEPFATALNHWLRSSPVLAPEDYALLLHGLGLEQVRVELRVYLHLMPSREDLIEWTRGTLLTAYQERLPAALFARYLDRYREHLLMQLPDERPYPYPFKRILMWATAPAQEAAP
jgi:trans-aconitate 2-methyltransferase